MKRYYKIIFKCIKNEYYVINITVEIVTKLHSKPTKSQHDAKQRYMQK